MASRPPVTLQEDWETTLRPWLDRVARQLEVDGVALDVDRVHQMTGVVAEGVQRSMAPISAFLVGAAVARGASLEEACAAVEDVTRERASAAGASHPRGGGRYISRDYSVVRSYRAHRAAAGRRQSRTAPHL